MRNMEQSAKFKMAPKWPTWSGRLLGALNNFRKLCPNTLSMRNIEPTQNSKMAASGTQNRFFDQSTVSMMKGCDGEKGKRNTLANWYLKVPWNLNLNVAKWSQIGPIGPYRTKQDQTAPNGAKWVKTGPNRVKRAKRGQTRPNGADVFVCMHILMRRKKSCLATKALRQKLAELWEFCWFQDFHVGPWKQL